MISSLDLDAWANQIISDLDISDSISTSQVSTWLENNVGRLNLLLGTEYEAVLNTDDEPSSILPEMSQLHIEIYSKMYECWYYKLSSKNAATSALYTFTEIKGEEQGTLKKASAVEVAKMLKTLADGCDNDLKKMLSGINGLGSVSQIIGRGGCC